MLEFVYEGQVEFADVRDRRLALWRAHGRDRPPVPQIDIASIHLGGTKLAGILITTEGAQGAEPLELTKPALAPPIHSDDYPVSTSPVTNFERQRALRPDAAGCRVVVLERGQEQPLSV